VHQFTVVTLLHSNNNLFEFAASFTFHGKRTGKYRVSL